MAIRKASLIEYILKDKIENIDVDHPNNVEEITTVMNNGKVRSIMTVSEKYLRIG